MSSASRRRLFVLAAALAMGACLSPTLPLPPPSEPTLSGPDEVGRIELAGRVKPGAWVFAMNHSTNAGAFSDTDEEGRYRIQLAASAGDSLSLWYEIEGNVSESLSIQVPPP